MKKVSLNIKNNLIMMKNHLEFVEKHPPFGLVLFQIVVKVSGGETKGVKMTLRV